jgi:fatty-acyl-CoA synthase
MPHVEIKIVDGEGRIVPIKCVGEIYARSRFIMRGYYEDHEKTAETISDDGWLRTGDMGMMDEDGYLYFTGRKKEIIIRASTNIWPIEIEQAIGEHESVAEVYVFSIPDPIYDESICAFVKLKLGMQCEVEELKTFLSNKLTAYKVPTYIQFVDEFIRTSIGKVSKAELAQEMINRLSK